MGDVDDIRKSWKAREVDDDSRMVDRRLQHPRMLTGTGTCSTQQPNDDDAVLLKVKRQVLLLQTQTLLCDGRKRLLLC